MDPELIQLLAAAKLGNKNLSGTLNNLQDPFFTYLAGIYDPIAAQGGMGSNTNGPYWSRYSTSEEPVIQDIISKIRSGADKYQLNSYIDSLSEGGTDLGAFQVSDLKGVAGQLQKEYSGESSGSSSKGGSKGDPFAKGNASGFRSPLDLYSISDMPVGKKGSAGLTKIANESSSTVKAMEAAQLAATKAMSDLGPLFNGFDSRGGVKAPSVDQMINYVKSNKDLMKQVPGGMDKIDPTTGDMYSWAGTKNTKNYKFYDPRGLMNIIDIPLMEGFRTAEQVANSVKGKKQNNIQDLVYKAGKLPSEEAIKKVKKAQEQEGLAEGQMNAAQYESELYRKGMLRALAETGRTPLGDQVKTLLKFAALSK